MKRALVVVDMGYGDSGKGSMTDYLCRVHKAKLVVRFSGGPQCSHHVAVGDTCHGFSQMGSGTFTCVPTYYSQHAIFEPFALFNERLALSGKGINMGDSHELFSVHEDTIVVTPWHWKLNRLKEQSRGKDRHGSCGFGVGEVRSDQLNGYSVLRVKDLYDPLHILEEIRDNKIADANQFGCPSRDLVNEKVEELASLYKNFAKSLNIVDEMPKVDGTVIFEGSQGILIDQELGFEPYRTWTDVTPQNARYVCAESGISDVHVLGLVPAIMSRHGPGPFVSEIRQEFETNNKEGRWQGPVRWGTLDLVAMRYVLANVKIDSIALTHTDRRGVRPDYPNYVTCEAYETDTGFDYNISRSTSALTLMRCLPVRGKCNFEELQDCLGPIEYISSGPTVDEKTRCFVPA